ncbi:MAG: hypothetical protein JWR84_301 [Caulobacter sp.]|nr:hypothetical protein [Caulobacter sp.]
MMLFLAACAPASDREVLRARDGDANLVLSAPLRREMLRAFAGEYHRYVLPTATPTEITGRYLNPAFCLFDKTRKAHFWVMESVSVLPPATVEAWAAKVLDRMADTDDCGLRLFVRERAGRPEITAVYDVLELAQAPKSRSIAGDGVRLKVIAAPRGDPATFSERAARLAGHPVKTGRSGDFDSWTVDGDSGAVASERHAEALLVALAGRLSWGDMAIPEGRAVELTEILVNNNTARFCAMSATDKAPYYALTYSRVTASISEAMRRGLKDMCHLRIFAERDGAIVRLAAVYELPRSAKVQPPPILRHGPVRLGLAIMSGESQRGAPAAVR